MGNCNGGGGGTDSREGKGAMGLGGVIVEMGEAIGESVVGCGDCVGLSPNNEEVASIGLGASCFSLPKNFVSDGKKSMSILVVLAFGFGAASKKPKSADEEGVSAAETKSKDIPSVGFCWGVSFDFEVNVGDTKSKSRGFCLGASFGAIKVSPNKSIPDLPAWESEARFVESCSTSESKKLVSDLLLPKVGPLFGSVSSLAASSLIFVEKLKLDGMPTGTLVSLLEKENTELDCPSAPRSVRNVDEDVGKESGVVLVGRGASGSGGCALLASCPSRFEMKFKSVLVFGLAEGVVTRTSVLASLICISFFVLVALASKSLVYEEPDSTLVQTASKSKLKSTFLSSCGGAGTVSGLIATGAKGGGSSTTLSIV